MSKKNPVKRAVPGTHAHVAAVRWYTLKMELRALELVVTNGATFSRVREIFDAAMTRLDDIEPLAPTLMADCPPPWDICPDEICRPRCGDVRLSSLEESATEQRRKKR